jgi:hypothetical protein
MATNSGFDSTVFTAMASNSKVNAVAQYMFVSRRNIDSTQVRARARTVVTLAGSVASDYVSVSVARGMRSAVTRRVVNITSLVWFSFHCTGVFS